VTLARRALVAAWVLSAGCGGARTPAPGAQEPLKVVPLDDRVLEVIAAALESDARLESADSLYDREAVLVANGEVRYAPPRYAGVGQAGAIAIASSRMEMRGGLAWAQIEYRWMSTAAGVAREGRATFIMVPNDNGAWRIRHAHSSSAEPAP